MSVGNVKKVLAQIVTDMSLLHVTFVSIYSISASKEIKNANSWNEIQNCNKKVGICLFRSNIYYMYYM